MMAKYSDSSESKLDTANVFLQSIFRFVIQFYDNTIIQGHRPVAEQLEYYNSGASKVKFGRHNVEPSDAVDSAPYITGRKIPWPKVPKDWNDKPQRDQYIKDLNQFYHYGGFVEGVASMTPGGDIRWGGDWDRDNNIADQSFNDLVHFEKVVKNPVREA
jgi:hypothetical protein